MKLIVLAALVCLSSLLIANEQFKPLVSMEHKKMIDDAFNHLIKEMPELKDKNIQLVNLSYSFMPAEGTVAECGPTGCVLKPTSPFVERLNIAFQVMDSKRPVVKDGKKCSEYDGFSVQFPTHRKKDWFIGKSVITTFDNN